MWGKQATFNDLTIKLKKSEPVDGCKTYSYDPPKKPTAYVVVGLNKCPLSNLIHNAQAYGASALFIVNHESTDVMDIKVPDHLAGVQIHVFLINKQQGEKLISALSSDTQEDVIIKINFIETAKRNSTINIEMTFSPEDSTATRFLAEMYQSAFTHDILEEKLKLKLRYSMLFCSACEERGFTMAKDNCLSGGRYCMKSINHGDNLPGEVMLIQVIKNMCTEKILREQNRPKDIWSYYWTYNMSCVNDFLPQCFNTILQRLNIKDQVFQCIKNSFEKTAETSDTSSEPKILLQDNSLLRSEMAEFKKIEQYSSFPMLKINGMIFYGVINYKEVVTFICQHLSDTLQGCKSIKGLNVVIVEKSGGATIFKWFAIIFVIAVFAVVIELCRRALKKKFEGELSYQIDKSISSFLERTGGSDL